MDLNQNQKKIIFLVVFLLLISFGLYQNTNKTNELDTNGIITKGEVVEFNHSRKTTYFLKYRFEVNGKEYYGSEVTSFFKCSDSISGCVGKSFNIKYSKNDPEISEIDLEEFNVYKKLAPKFKF